SVRHLGDRRLPPSPRAGLREVVAHAPPAAPRPPAELGLADDVLHRNRAPDAPAALHARVAGVVAVVAHDEHRPPGHGDLGELLLTRASARLEVQVRLVQRLAVDEHPVLRVTALDGLAADGDDPLDEVPLVRRREPDHRPELTEETGDSGALLD